MIEIVLVVLIAGFLAIIIDGSFEREKVLRDRIDTLWAYNDRQADGRRAHLHALMNVRLLLRNSKPQEALDTINEYFGEEDKSE